MIKTDLGWEILDPELNETNSKNLRVLARLKTREMSEKTQSEEDVYYDLTVDSWPKYSTISILRNGVRMCGLYTLSQAMQFVEQSSGNFEKRIKACGGITLTEEEIKSMENM